MRSRRGAALPGQEGHLDHLLSLELCPCRHPGEYWVSATHSKDGGRAELLALTVRARAHLRSHLRHHELCGQITQMGLSNVLFALVQPSKQCCAVAVAAAVAAVRHSRVLPAPV
ncbi:hypothetical protein H8959_017280 [Pygathrix nigripes]